MEGWKVAWGLSQMNVSVRPMVGLQDQIKDSEWCQMKPWTIWEVHFKLSTSCLKRKEKLVLVWY